MAKRKPKQEPVIFASTETTLYVMQEAVMPFLVAVFDGVSLTTFPDKRNVPYMTVTDAIAWCESEITKHGNKTEMMATRLAVLRGAQAGFDHEKQNGFPNGDRFKLRMPDAAPRPE